MSKSFAVAVVLFVNPTGAALAQAIFDSPGRGYREQRDEFTRPEFGQPLDRIHPNTGKVMARIKPLWPAGPATKRKVVARFSSADEGAAGKAHRALTNAGIPFLITPGDEPVVFVDPSRLVEAKTLLQKLSQEGHWSVKTVTPAGGFE